MAAIERSRSRLFFLSILLLFVFALSIRKVSDPDTLWQIRAGEHILKSFTVPHNDIFTSLNPYREWINTGWLAEVIFYIFFAIGGFSLLIIFKAFVVAGAYGLLFRLVRSMGAPFHLSYIFVFLAALASRERFLERPHIFSLMILPLFLLFVMEEHGGSHHQTPLKSRGIWLLPLTMIVWANLHAGCIIGILALFLLVLGKGIKLLFSRSDELSYTEFKRWTIYFILTVLASLINPYTFRLYDFLFLHLSVISRIRIAEFRPLLSPDAPFLLPTAAIFIFMFFFILNIKHRDISEIFLFVPFTILPFVMRRWIGDSLMVMAMLAGRHPKGLRLDTQLRPIARAGGILLLFLPLVTFGIIYHGDRLHYIGLGIMDTVYPKRALEFIDSLGLPGTIYNSSNYGGAIIFRWFPQKKAFQDTRLVSAVESVEGALIGMRTTEAAQFFEALLSYKGVTHALVELSLQYRARGLFPDDRWVLLYWDDYSEIFVRRSYLTKKIIKKYGEFSYNPEAIVAVLELSQDLPPNISEGLERAIALNPDGILARAAFARAVMVQKGDLKIAWDVLKEGLGKRPDSFYANYVAARLRAEAGIKDDAWVYCSKMKSLRGYYKLTSYELSSYLKNVSDILARKGIPSGPCI